MKAKSHTILDRVCEHGKCRNIVGKDYHRKYKLLRKILGDEWVNEPVYLCNKHSKGHKLYE